MESPEAAVESLDVVEPLEAAPPEDEVPEPAVAVESVVAEPEAVESDEVPVLDPVVAELPDAELLAGVVLLMFLPFGVDPLPTAFALTLGSMSSSTKTVKAVNFLVLVASILLLEVPKPRPSPAMHPLAPAAAGVAE